MFRSSRYTQRVREALVGEGFSAHEGQVNSTVIELRVGARRMVTDDLFDSVRPSVGVEQVTHEIQRQMVALLVEHALDMAKDMGLKDYREEVKDLRKRLDDAYRHNETIYHVKSFDLQAIERIVEYIEGKKGDHD